MDVAIGWIQENKERISGYFDHNSALTHSKHMKIKLFLFCLVPIIISSAFRTNESPNYMEYHKQIIEAERLISQEEFEDALIKYEQLFEIYDFVFIRDYKVATQLAFYLNDRNKGFDLLRKGIANGWHLKDIQKDDFLKPFQKDTAWSSIEHSYSNLHSKYRTRINADLRERVRFMFKKDQKKAMGAFIKLGNKAKEKYGKKKFAPHSEEQMFELIDIFEKDAYPGEKIIGNDFWMSTIISHHNSIALEYVKKDTLYDFVKPQLFKAVEQGEMSPYEYALIDDWKKAVLSGRSEVGYGFLSPPKRSTLLKTNQLRSKIGLRSVELRNKLVEVERKTGMNFYLPDWVQGAIDIE